MSETRAPFKKPRSWRRRLRLWRARLDRMARGPLALPALFAGSVLESTLLPWPIEFPLLAYMLRGRRQVVEATLVVTLGSVLGCVLSYWAGRLALDLAAEFISARPDLALSLEGARARIDAYGAWAVGVSMLTPVPVQLSSFAAGAALIPAPLFVLAAFSGRLVRYGAMGVLLFIFGRRVLWLWARLPNGLRLAVRLGALALFALMMGAAIVLVAGGASAA